MDFPRYDGKSDPLIFINRRESYFHQQRIMEEEKVWMASYNLEEGAQMVVHASSGGREYTVVAPLQGPHQPLLWAAAPICTTVRARRLPTHRHGHQVPDRFQALLPHAGPLAESQRVQLFTGGLLPPIRNVVRIHNPQTLAGAMSLARQLEQMELCTPAPIQTKPASRGLLPAPTPCPTLPAPAADKSAAPPVKVDGPPVKRLSWEEQEEHHCLSLCYNCNEKYSRGHNRTCRRIFFVNGVEITDDDAATDAEQATETPVFSLHAVAGVPTCDTMQVRVSFGATTLVALLGTESAHNFSRMWRGVPTCPSSPGRVSRQRWPMVRIMCPDVLRQAPISIVNTEFNTDLFVMPLAGYDLVLGT
jgi:hypothetical protein